MNVIISHANKNALNTFQKEKPMSSYGIHSFPACIHVLNIHVVNVYYRPGTVLDCGNIIMNQTSSLSLWRLQSSGGDGKVNTQ